LQAAEVFTRDAQRDSQDPVAGKNSPLTPAHVKSMRVCGPCCRKQDEHNEERVMDG
jgi:hypothetical protein